MDVGEKILMLVVLALICLPFFKYATKKNGWQQYKISVCMLLVLIASYSFGTYVVQSEKQRQADGFYRAVEEKSKSYAVYVDDFQVNTDKLVFEDYPMAAIVVDDTENKIYIQADNSLFFYSNIVSKAKEYTVYVNGVPADWEHIDIYSYSVSCIHVDDAKQEIYISSI